MSCAARRYNDEMICGRCGLTWAVDETDPPDCATEPTCSMEEALERMREVLNRD